MKGFSGGLVYPPGVWGLELAGIIVFYIFALIRIDWGCRANRTENKSALVVFLVFTLFSFLFYIYFSLLTTYVLRIEFGFGLTGAFFPLIELLFTCIAIGSIGDTKNTL